MLIQNKAATHHYEILDTVEAGIKLLGWEVKSLRRKQGHLKGAWIREKDGELWLEKSSIAPYPSAQGEMPRERPRQLLVKKREFRKILKYIGQPGFSLIPLRIESGRRLQCVIGVGRGRKKHEKKQVLKERALDRQVRNFRL